MTRETSGSRKPPATPAGATPRQASDSTVRKEKSAEAVTETQSPVHAENAARMSREDGHPPGHVVGYRIIRQIGEGAFGSVWLATEERTGKRVAIKFYSQRRGLDWAFLNREVEKLAALYTSRNIVGLIEVGWDSDPPHYIMEYLEPGSLEDRLAAGPLPVPEAVRIANGVLQALISAHNCGILHCDLKPANVLLDSEIEPRLCDFGQSRLLDEHSGALGTMFYMAPEQADTSAVADARWDVYALGALMYHMLCGSPPYRTDESAHEIAAAETLKQRLETYRRILRESPPPTDHRRVSGVDSRLAEILERCLAVDPAERFPNAQSVLEMFEQRERERVRRPLLAVGILAPVLVLMAVFLMAQNGIRTAVQTSRETLAERAMAGDVIPVQLMALSVQRELEDRQARLIELAADPRLREMMLAHLHKDYEGRAPLRELLDGWRRQDDALRESQGRELDESWFLTDADGWQRWRFPLNTRTIDRNFSHRDYFHGHGTEYRQGAATERVEPIRQPYISLAFRSQATNKYMVAISVPVWDETHENVLGILARTTHLGQLLSGFGDRIRGSEGSSRLIALLDSRDWKLLDHPWMTAESSKDLGDIKDSKGRWNDRDGHYRDPVGRLDPENYGGEWLAAFAPVGELGWIAIVQERRDVALRPVSEVQAVLIQNGVWALLVSSVLVGVVWYFVTRALPSRRLM